MNQAIKKAVFFTLLFLIIGISIVSCEKEVPKTGGEEVEWVLYNWNDITDIVTTEGQTASNLKVAHDNENLYFLILGADMESHQLLIDSDKNTTTGYKDLSWSGVGFDYLLEDDVFYELPDNSISIKNELVTDFATVIVSPEVKEISIKRSAFKNLTGKIKIGLKDNKSGFTKSYLPEKNSDAALYVVDSLTVTTFEVTSSAGEGGAISPNSVTEVVQGEDITFTITPIEGDYDIESVIVDGLDIGSVSSYSFYDVQENHTISVEFSQIDKRLIALSPYLISYDHSSMDVLFRTSKIIPANSVNVDWGTTESYGENSGELIVDDRDGENRYQYRISGLVEGQKYFYRVNVDTSSLTGSFYPRPVNAPAKFSFYGLGDTQDAYGDQDDGIWPAGFGKDEVAHAIYNDIMENPTERQNLILYGGDLNNSYNYWNWYGCFFNPTTTWASWLNRNTLTVAAMGNHDGANTDHSRFRDFFPLANTDNITAGGGYYSVDYGSVHVVVITPFGNLDWNDEGGHPKPGEPQWIWLENDLQTASQDPDIKFIICVYHDPAYTLGGHEDNEVLQHVTNELFEPYGVDMCLSGHNHYFARGLVDNIHHVTLGSGGATQGSSALDPVNYPHITEYAEGTFFSRFTVEGDVLTTEVFEHTGNGLTNPVPVDSFTVNASDN